MTLFIRVDLVLHLCLFSVRKKFIFDIIGPSEAKINDKVTIRCGYSGDFLEDVILTLGDKGGTFVKRRNQLYRDGKELVMAGKCRIFKDSKFCLIGKWLQVIFMAAPKFSGNVTCNVRIVSY